MLFIQFGPLNWEAMPLYPFTILLTLLLKQWYCNIFQTEKIIPDTRNIGTLLQKVWIMRKWDMQMSLLPRLQHQRICQDLLYEKVFWFCSVCLEKCRTSKMFRGISINEHNHIANQIPVGADPGEVKWVNFHPPPPFF